jgi:hypothetical protein
MTALQFSDAQKAGVHSETGCGRDAGRRDMPEDGYWSGDFLQLEAQVRLSIAC